MLTFPSEDIQKSHWLVFLLGCPPGVIEFDGSCLRTTELTSQAMAIASCGTNEVVVDNTTVLDHLRINGGFRVKNAKIVRL